MDLRPVRAPDPWRAARSIRHRRKSLNSLPRFESLTPKDRFLVEEMIVRFYGEDNEEE